VLFKWAISRTDAEIGGHDPFQRQFGATIYGIIPGSAVSGVRSLAACPEIFREQSSIKML
jgi:hypothetical protein